MASESEVSRVSMMADARETKWDLSPRDKEALAAVLRELGGLRGVEVCAKRIAQPRTMGPSAIDMKALRLALENADLQRQGKAEK